MRKAISMGVVGLAVVGAAGFGTYTVSALNGTGYGAANGGGTAAMAGNGQGNGYGAQTALETRATALNMTAEQLQTQLQTKTVAQVAESQGLTLDQYQAKMREAAQARWADRGLSDEEIASRTATQTERQANCDGSGTQQHMGGYGPNREQ